MSYFYGTLQGSRATPTCCGTKNSGLNATAAGWQGAISVYIREVDGVDHYTVDLIPWQGSGGRSTRIAEGILDANVAEDTRPNIHQVMRELRLQDD